MWVQRSTADITSGNPEYCDTANVCACYMPIAFLGSPANNRLNMTFEYSSTYVYNKPISDFNFYS